LATGRGLSASVPLGQQLLTKTKITEPIESFAGALSALLEVPRLAEQLRRNIELAEALVRPHNERPVPPGVRSDIGRIAAALAFAPSLAELLRYSNLVDFRDLNENELAYLESASHEALFGVESGEAFFRIEREKLLQEPGRLGTRAGEGGVDWTEDDGAGGRWPGAARRRGSRHGRTDGRRRCLLTPPRSRRVSNRSKGIAELEQPIPPARGRPLPHVFEHRELHGEIE